MSDAGPDKVPGRGRDVESVKRAVTKLNRGRREMRELERQLKPYIDAKRAVAEYFKRNPGVGMMFDEDEEHYCSAIRNTQTRFDAAVARQKLGEAVSECYVDKTVVSIGYGVEQEEPGGNEDAML
eukprot:jgi/Tetstr1/454215/TSEL_041134.t1